MGNESNLCLACKRNIAKKCYIPHTVGKCHIFPIFGFLKSLYHFAKKILLCFLMNRSSTSTPFQANKKIYDFSIDFVTELQI